MRRIKKKKKLEGFLGIDPGKKGAAVLLLSNDKILYFDWPQKDDYFEVRKVLGAWKKKYKIRFAILEKVSSRPDQSAQSGFSFGTNFGAWLMALEFLDVRYLTILPQIWQSKILHKSDGREPKDRVRAQAIRLFGYESFHGPRGGYKDGRGDAAMMAYKARIMTLGGGL